MISWLLEPFSYAFMRTGALAALFVGLSCAMLGVHVILRRMAFIGDALSHTVLPGVVLAYLNGWSLFLGALVSALLTALGIGWISRRNMLREDTAIGVLFTGMFALGILLISTVRSFRDFTHILFGNILGVTPENLLVTASVTLLVLVVLLLFHKELELTAVDPIYAEVIGLHPDRMRMLLLVLLACTIVTSIQVVGVVLTSALLITPAAAASLLTRHMGRMIWIAAAISIISSLLGLYFSYYNGVSSGAAIVLTCTVFFGMAWLMQVVRRIRASRANVEF